MPRPTLRSRVALTLFILLFVLTGCSLRVNSTTDDYLKRNYASIDLNGDPAKQFHLLDDNLSYNVFLTGEQHAIRTNYDLQLALLKYFNRKAGVRYLLSELGYSQSAVINEYLSTGDEEFLRKVFQGVKGTAAWSKEYLEFLQLLREYNQTLPPDRTIKVIGIDIEFQLGTALDYLHSIIPNGDIPVEIQPTIDAFKASEPSLNASIDVRKLLELLQKDNVMESLQQDIEQHQDAYKQYLGSKFFDFSIVVDNIINSMKCHSTTNTKQPDVLREQSIYDNFKRVYSNFPRGKYFGQWGGEHVYQKARSNDHIEKSFAMYLNRSDSPVRDKVLSMAYGYQNCSLMNTKKNYKSTLAPPILQDLDRLKGYTKSDVTMFKLNSNKSPYNSELHFVGDSTGGATTQYFQYIVVIRNSPAATPYGKIDPSTQ